MKAKERNQCTLSCEGHENADGFTQDGSAYECTVIEWEDNETGERYREQLVSDIRREQQETTILGLLHEISHLVRRAMAMGVPVCVKGHPVDIGFCFNDDSPMHEMFRGGYKVNDDLLDEWDDIERLLRLFT